MIKICRERNVKEAKLNRAVGCMSGMRMEDRERQGFLMLNIIGIRIG
jgi:hypothetical protein